MTELGGCQQPTAQLVILPRPFKALGPGHHDDAPPPAVRVVAAVGKTVHRRPQPQLGPVLDGLRVLARNGHGVTAGDLLYLVVRPIFLGRFAGDQTGGADDALGAKVLRQVVDIEGRVTVPH